MFATLVKWGWWIAVWAVLITFVWVAAGMFMLVAELLKL